MRQAVFTLVTRGCLYDVGVKIWHWAQWWNFWRQLNNWLRVAQCENPFKHCAECVVRCVRRCRGRFCFTLKTTKRAPLSKGAGLFHHGCDVCVCVCVCRVQKHINSLASLGRVKCRVPAPIPVSRSDASCTGTGRSRNDTAPTDPHHAPSVNQAHVTRKRRHVRISWQPDLVRVEQQVSNINNHCQGKTQFAATLTLAPLGKFGPDAHLIWLNKPRKTAKYFDDRKWRQQPVSLEFNQRPSSAEGNERAKKSVRDSLTFCNENSYLRERAVNIFSGVSFWPRLASGVTNINSLPWKVEDWGYLRRNVNLHLCWTLQALSRTDADMIEALHSCETIRAQWGYLLMGWGAGRVSGFVGLLDSPEEQKARMSSVTERCGVWLQLGIDEENSRNKKRMWFPRLFFCVQSDSDFWHLDFFPPYPQESRWTTRSEQALIVQNALILLFVIKVWLPDPLTPPHTRTPTHHTSTRTHPPAHPHARTHTHAHTPMINS